MATEKKSSRDKNKRSRSNPRSYSSLYKDDRTAVPQENADTEQAAATDPVGPKDSDTVDWKTEYAYVVKDLRQLVIVSAVLFALIIGIGFFI